MKGTYIPVYWSPDIAPDWNINPGVLTAVTDMYPTKRGTLKSYACTSASGYGTDTTTRGTPLTGRSLRTYVGTTGYAFIGTTKRILYEDAGAGALTDVGDYNSGVLANYTTAADWHFAAWGSQILAVSKANAPATLTIGSSGTFTGNGFVNLGGSPPKSSLCCVQNDQLLLADCNDGSSDLPDQVCWSGIGNLTSWTTGANNLATQAGNNRLRATSGAIRAMVPLGRDVICYKADSIYIGRYTGRSPLFWEWECLSRSVGCASPHGVAEFGDTHYFVHTTGIYRLSVGGALERVNLNAAKYLKTGGYSLFSMHAGVDQHEGLIVWYLKANATTTTAFSAGLAFNVMTNQLGWIGTPWTSYSAIGVMHGDYSDLQPSDLGGPSSSQLGFPLVGYSGTTIAAQYPTALGTTCSLTTGHMGGDTEYIQSLRITPRCYSLTSLSSATDNNRDRIYDGSPTATSATENDERIDVLASNRWHQLTFTMSGAELAGLTIEGLKVSDD